MGSALNVTKMMIMMTGNQILSIVRFGVSQY